MFTCTKSCSCPFVRTFHSAGTISHCSLHPLDGFNSPSLAEQRWGGSAGLALHSQAPLELWFHGSAGLSWQSPSTKWFVCAGLFFLRAELVWALLIVLPQPTLGWRTLRASSGFAYGSQQEFCLYPWHFFDEGQRVCCALCPPSPLLLTQVVYPIETGCQ